MPIAQTTPVEEIENIEQDDDLHDFGGSHGTKGHDFAHFWLIVRILEVEKAQQGDYLFVCEYVQDVAEFNSSAVPSDVVLYQLKKKEDGYWTAADLTGQTLAAKKPKESKPLVKLYKGVRAFKSINARGFFVSNAKFDIKLASSESSVNSVELLLSELEQAHADGLRVGLGAFNKIQPSDVDLQRLGLRRVSLHVDDLQRHTNGVMLDFLQTVAPEHINQASSLVDTLYVRIKATARRTDKCKSWAELSSTRGFGKSDFKNAIESLSATPDGVATRRRIFEKLANEWTTRKATRVEVALTRCAQEKVILGVANRWSVDLATVHAACEHADANDHTDRECFEAVVTALAHLLPDASEDEINALAIYEMSEWNLNQIPA